jgi:choline kinase
MPNPKRAIIFAAGRGSRLGHYTKDLPKTLLTVGKLTIFDRIVIGLDKVGINDIVVVTGHASERLESHALSHSSKLARNHVKFQFIINDKLDIGNIYSFWLARERMTEDFLLLNSDVVFDQGILDLLTNNEHPTALAIDDRKHLGVEEMKVMITNQGIIKDITKDIEPSVANGEYIGIMKVSSGDATKIIEKVQQLLSEKRSPLYYEDALRLVAKEKDCLFACSTIGLPWTEIDTEDDMNYAQGIILPQLKSPA